MTDTAGLVMCENKLITINRFAKDFHDSNLILRL